MIIKRPSLVVLMGIAGTGKSTWAAENFKPDEVVSSDRCRELLCGSARNQSIHKETFELVHKLVDLRLSLGFQTVVDVTGLSHRQPYIDAARKHGVPVYLVVVQADIEEIKRRDAGRSRNVGASVIEKQAKQLDEALNVVEKEDWDAIFSLNLNYFKGEGVDFEYNNQVQGFPPPYTIIGDIHGCYSDFLHLLFVAGWSVDGSVPYNTEGRRAIFVGDLVDRGPDSAQVIDTVRRMVAAGSALCIRGNHDQKLLKWLMGNKIKPSNGLSETIRQIEILPNREKWKEQTREFLDSLPHYLILDAGKLVVAHAGIEENMIGTTGKLVESFCLYGDMIGQNPETGFPIRRDWAADYHGKPYIVYGHQPQMIDQPRFVNRTVNLDLAGVFGNKFAALQYPEMEFVTIDSTVSTPRVFQDASKEN